MAATREVTIVNHHGMHMRPAMQIVEVSNRFGSDVRIHKGEHAVNAKSIMEVMTLEAPKGTVLTLQADGDDAEAALEALAELVSARFGED